MNDTRTRSTPTSEARVYEAIPEAQSRALERRHALDQQQRSYRKPGASPYPPRHRPPA
jgi:hypothetical protein